MKKTLMGDPTPKQAARNRRAALAQYRRALNDRTTLSLVDLYRFMASQSYGPPAPAEEVMVRCLIEKRLEQTERRLTGLQAVIQAQDQLIVKQAEMIQLLKGAI